MIVTINKDSGFCLGVVSAIQAAEKELSQEVPLYCLGDIVHNNAEVERLYKMGLKVINYEQFSSLHDTKVLIRAHGEPPSTYQTAKDNNIELIDATCKIVLKLQEKIRIGFLEMQAVGGQVLIFGKEGHAEVIGLNGQTGNQALIISKFEDLKKVNFHKPIRLYAQTTMSAEEYTEVVNFVQKQCDLHQTDCVTFHSICKLMENRSKKIPEFATHFEAIVFVSDKKSSNGQYLYTICKHNNPNTYFISDLHELNKYPDLFRYQSIGICGATSTPMWLMEKIKHHLENPTI